MRLNHSWSAEVKRVNDNLSMNNNISLPALPSQTLPALNSLTQALGIPRETLASEEEINYAWQNLPRELKDILAELRD
jgi:hypothetical protein